MTLSTECKSCTVPTDGAELCSFCRTYSGPPITDSTLTGPGSGSAECRYCAQAVDGHGDVCEHCADRTPADPLAGPVALLGTAHVQARHAAEDLSDCLDELPDDAPLLAVVDIVGARAHLVAAQRLIDKAAERITATEAVAR